MPYMPNTPNIINATNQTRFDMNYPALPTPTNRLHFYLQSTNAGASQQVWPQQIIQADGNGYVDQNSYYQPFMPYPQFANGSFVNATVPPPQYDQTTFVLAQHNQLGSNNQLH